MGSSTPVGEGIIQQFNLFLFAATPLMLFDVTDVIVDNLYY